MENLRLAYLQQNIVWENTAANLRKIDGFLKQMPETDLLILPEMFNTGFTNNTTKLAQTMDGQLVGWMKERASDYNMAIMGSAIINDNGHFVNRLIFAYPCADVKWYDKRHLFRMGNEHEHFTGGSNKVIFNYFGWRIRPLICYDLRFPVWSRNQNDYDLLVYVANWPKPRREVFTTLLKARAIENQCYVAGVNRVGTDGQNIEYSGDSLIINPMGNIISVIEGEEEKLKTVSLSLSELKAFRDKFPVHLDADKFTIL